MKILHIISGLNSGGAEGVLYRLICKDNKNDHHVISLTDQGIYGDLLKKKNISIDCLNIKKNFYSVFFFIKLIFLIKKKNPNLIQCWMYHADLLGGIAGRIVGIKKIYWNLRNSDLNFQWSNKTTILISKIASYLSYILPYRIISCSNKSSTTHLELGYCKKKIFLITNGFDEKRFYFSKKLKQNWKYKLKIHDNNIVFGFVGRWSNQKDFETLFKAFSFFRENTKNSNNLKLLLVGKDINKDNYELSEKIRKYRLIRNIILVDETIHINQLLNVVDIGVFSSKGNEGFPNAIAEKMLTKIPCIVADVGDTKKIVGNIGWVYKKRDWIDLNKKLNFVYNNFFLNHKIWIVKKNFSRKRIIDNFSLDQMIERYNKIWKL